MMKNTIGINRLTGLARLTRLARQVIFNGRQEAKKLNSKHINSEHLLLALIKGERGIAANVLVNLRMNFSEIEKEVIKLINNQSEEAKKENDNFQARKIVMQAIEESKSLKHNYVGTEDLLLAMLCFKEGIAAQALANLNLDFDNVRPETERILDGMKT